MAIAHHFTVDVEEHFQVQALAPYIPRSDWDRWDSRVEHNVDRLLELLATRDSKGTFFILGWVAERHSAMVKRVAAGGHEIASHGWDHLRIPEQTREHFTDSVRRTRELLEQLTGEPVLGFRAPSFSIIPGYEWALDVLLETGHRYDSSLFPVKRRGYGYRGGDRDPYWIKRPGGSLLEVPPATLRRGGLNLPAAGGAYFRLLPYGLVRSALRDAEARGVPGTFYIHPWEYDPDQSRVRVPLLTRIRHYGRQGAVFGKLQRLVEEFSFRPINTLALLATSVR